MDDKTFREGCSNMLYNYEQSEEKLSSYDQYANAAMKARWCDNIIAYFKAYSNEMRN